MEDNRILFEARYRWDFGTMRRVYSVLMGKRRYVMMVILLVLLALYLYVLSSVEVHFSWNMVFIPLLLLFYILWPYYMAWFAVKQHRKLMNGEEKEVLIRFSDKEIESSEIRNVQFFQYEQITQIRSTSTLWLMMIGRKMAIPIPKASFTQGRAEEFPAFIRTKCPNIKGFR